jgi:hypothetical protein
MKASLARSSRPCRLRRETIPHDFAQCAGAPVDGTKPLRMTGPDPRKPVRREIVAALIGAEVGAGFGLLALGGTLLAPLGMAVFGAAAGAGVARLRVLLIRRWLREQLRAAR